MPRGYVNPVRTSGLTTRNVVRRAFVMPDRESASRNVGTRYDYHRRALALISTQSSAYGETPSLDTEWWHHRRKADAYHRAMMTGQTVADLESRSILPKDW